MKKYRATKMANGGKTPNGKKKAAESAEVVSRQQAVENEKLVKRREAEDRQSTKNIYKDISLNTGVQSYTNPYTGKTSKFSRTLADAKQAPASTTDDTYTASQTADMLSRKVLPALRGQEGGARRMQAPIFKKGQTGGYATNREISRGAGFTMGKDAVTPRMGVQRAVGAPVAKQQLAKAGDYTEKEKEFFKKYPSAQRPQILPKGGIK